MKEYDVFVPLFYNSGEAIEPVKFQMLQERLLERFDGLTYFPQANQGFWKFGEVTFRDEIVIYRVITSDAAGAHVFFTRLKEELKQEFRQEEILIIERDIGLI